MALQTSGAISLNDIHVEAGGTSGTQASLNDADIRGLINKASGASSSFSGFYGASAAIGEIARGNSTYVAAGEYSAASYNLRSTAHTPIVNFDGTARVSNRPTFTMNNRNTQFLRVQYTLVNTLVFQLFDLSSSATTEGEANTAGVPANSGWTRMLLKNSSGTVVKNLTRASATYTAQASTGYNSTSFRYYSAWVWASQTNPFPSSNNTTLFIVELE